MVDDCRVEYLDAARADVAGRRAGIERDVMPARLHHPAEPDNLLGKGAGRIGRRGLGMRQRNDVEIHVPPMVTEAGYWQHHHQPSERFR